jgi:uncharacterized membrane protein YGL010W
MALMSSRSWDQWIAEYGLSHQDRRNRLCHTFGIPLIVLSLLGFVATVAFPRVWPIATTLFVVGWALQLIGHAFERKPPEFLKDWRFLFVGLRWWVAKIRRRA